MRGNYSRLCLLLRARRFLGDGSVELRADGLHRPLQRHKPTLRRRRSGSAEGKLRMTTEGNRGDECAGRSRQWQSGVEPPHSKKATAGKSRTVSRRRLRSTTLGKQVLPYKTNGDAAA